MSALLLLGVAALAGGSAWFASARLKVAALLEDPSPAEAAEERRYGRDRYVALPGYPQPDAADTDTQAADLTPDNDSGLDDWFVVYPDNAFPQDVEDFLTGVLRYARAAGSGRAAS